MDGSSILKQHPLCVVVAQGGDFYSLRLRVQEWVRANAAFPCRTEVTQSGFIIHYTGKEDGTLHHISIPSVSNRHEDYVRAYKDCGW